MNDKPHAPSCERNRDPILAVLREYFADRRRVLEIGSGTGQHAVHFGAALPQLQWQTSERAEAHAGIRAWLDEAALPNVLAPIALQIGRDPWPAQAYDAVFTANTLHIMAWPEVEQLFAGLGAGVLAPGGRLVVYGPFNEGGRYTSDSNAAFDEWLRARGAQMGLRDLEAVDALARGIGCERLADLAMPANNRSLVWQRRA
ncbi:DUF938 domain-containing protein [Solimonas variicoloris]|uniref:DUF938 domain-containing protein n=1 Tax=Solimonas variicoloris TaxID=254408 RepID=UPI0003717D67|nr:DUF938 domain-containing protein [Solimonas variicoloris]